ncbi:MAG: dipicolinate synthase subunit DpsA [Firmicutes bacterium]|nr:dipicolinate synthase subunit DpsA [Bacillota bacterium]
MAGLLEGVPVAVLGGDRREVELVRALAASGARVRVAGLPAGGVPGVERVRSAREAVAGARAVVAPMSGTDEHGRVPTPLEPSAGLRLGRELFGQMGSGTPLFIGTVRPAVAQAAAAAGVRVIEVAEIDEIAIANSVPTAEGAVQIAMEKLPVTIHGARALVIGFGRCGFTLARLLDAMGACVDIVSRRASDLARAEAMGLSAWPWPKMREAVWDRDVIFNTVPAPVLGEAVLARTRPGVLIVDIASAPGGTDFAAARRLGREALLAPGLPGKVAPVTAGRILARHLPGLIQAELVRSSKGASP